MKIFSSSQIKEWDKYTITHESVTSHQLMERAATACYQWLLKNKFQDKSYKIFCGKGNNGGDGLAIARMLIENKCQVIIYVLESDQPGSDDYQNNLSLLYTLTNNVHFIQSANDFPLINKHEVLIDALFGTGLNKPPGELSGTLINYINQSGATIISIDVPSGLYTDKSSKGNAIIRAGYTLTFQQYKLAFLVTENASFFGEVIVLDINLSADFYEQNNALFELTDINLIKAIYKPRKSFSNKGNFGHACLLAGSYGMMGAAILAARACLRGGVGKLTCAVCEAGYEIMQISVPEAMCKVYGNTFIKDFNNYKDFNALGIGPGIGMHTSHNDLLHNLCKNFMAPIIIDADALNTISENKHLLSLLPANSIITPHPKEFERLFGISENDFDRIELAIEKSIEYGIYIILKGHHTLIATPGKGAYFNSTGNAGMAKGGSGDVLTGILTSFAAQGYSSLETCLIGVYLHGMAGDIAAEKYSQQAMIAGDIVSCLGDAFKKIEEKLYV